MVTLLSMISKVASRLCFFYLVKHDFQGGFIAGLCGDVIDFVLVLEQLQWGKANLILSCGLLDR